MNQMRSISWDQSKKITEDMLARLVPLDEENLRVLDGENGIYIVAYEGDKLRFNLTVSAGAKPVYVGISKFNSSRHFKSGFTGTSTMRRSLGALLEHELDLQPIPRSLDENDQDRFNNYAFTAESEERLTVWMRENFQMAFLELDKEQLEAMQIALIEYNIPIFNFQHNPNNKYGAEIKNYRKKCAERAATHG
ncbi:MAG: GIY-YIG nuclease family protein [Bacillota bacterium]|jgi:hypothetical protein